LSLPLGSPLTWKTSLLLNAILKVLLAHLLDLENQSELGRATVLSGTHESSE